MTRFKHPTAWRTVAALALLLLAHRPAPAGEAGDPADRVEAALKAGDRARADVLSGAFQRQIQEADPVTVADAKSLRRVWVLYAGYGYYGKAEESAQALIRACERLSPPNPIAVVQAKIDLARVYRLEEDYVRAGAQYQKCRQDVTASRIPEHAWVRWLLENNVGKLYELMGQYDAAEDSYKAAQKVLEKKVARQGGKAEAQDLLDSATTLNNLGWLSHAAGKYEEAKAYVEEAKKIREKASAPADDIAESLNNLGLCLYSLGRYKEAKPLLRQAVDILRQKHGKDYPMAARYEHNLASLCRTLNEVDEARQLHEESIGVLERTLPPNHPDVAVARGYLASLYAARKAWSQAAEEMSKTRQLFREHIHHVLSAESEGEQLAFLKNKDRRWFSAAVTIAAQAGADPGVNPLAADWVLNGKAVTPEVLAERTVLARQSKGNPEVEALYKELREVRSELAARSLQSGAGTAAGPDRLGQREADLSRRLGQALQNSLTDPSWTDALQVQRALTSDKALAGDAVLLDFVRYTRIDFEAPGAELVERERRYAAWIMPPEGPVRIVDLGPADEIDRAVQELRKTMDLAIRGRGGKGPGTIKARGERESEKEFREPSAELGKLLLGKLYPYAGGYHRWVVSPDAELWLVPWSALVLPAGDAAGSYAVAKHTISLVSSGRALVAQPPRGVRRTAPLIFADADFGPLPQAGDHELLFEPLDYSADEGETIEPFLKRYTGTPPRRLTASRARERAFHEARSPQAVVLSTHGFFLDEGKGRPDNPFLRCGLALADANLRDERHAASGADDGILLGEEILDTDLRGTDLVVLSACETARGRVNGGEGVANLQSAFQLAGAQTVVATLWEVPDQQTGLLMCDFFERLAGGTADKAEALRQAQLAYIKEHRGGPNRAAHPFFWAALTMTGQRARTLDE